MPGAARRADHLWMRPEEETEPLLTIQVWQLLVLAGGLLALAAHFAVGLPLPAFEAGYWKLKLGTKALELAGLLVLLLVVVVAKRRSGADDATEPDEA